MLKFQTIHSENKHASFNFYYGRMYTNGIGCITVIDALSPGEVSLLHTQLLLSYSQVQLILA